MKKKDARKERALKTLKQAGAITREKHGSIPAPQVFKDRKKRHGKILLSRQSEFLMLAPITGAFFLLKNII